MNESSLKIEEILAKIEHRGKISQKKFVEKFRYRKKSHSSELFMKVEK